MSEGPIQIKIIAKTLFDFREFVIRNAVRWELGAGDHHHPMWSRVAQTLDAVGMNDGGPGHLDQAADPRMFVWHCPMCDNRLPETLTECPACASGIEEHAPGLFGADRDPEARQRAWKRGMPSFRQGPNHSTWYCTDCCTKLVHQWEVCSTCAAPVQSCHICGCTDDDCSGCIRATGKPCSWVHEPGEQPLCSACRDQDLPALIAAVDAIEGGPDDLDPAEAAALNGSTGELTRAEIRAGAEPPVIVTVDPITAEELTDAHLHNLVGITPTEPPTMIEGKRADEGNGCVYKSDTCKICEDGDLPKPVRVHGI